MRTGFVILICTIHPKILNSTCAAGQTDWNRHGHGGVCNSSFKSDIAGTYICKH